MKHEYTLDTFIEISRRFSNSDVKLIVEVGARDCCETVEFNKNFPTAKIFTFECNPQTLPLCRKNIQNISNITLIEKAVTNQDGKVKFFPIDPSRTRTIWVDGNPGASSLLQASGKYPIEEYAQSEIEVDSIKLSSFLRQNELNAVDLLWIDVQGAELLVLQGLENNIKDVKLIHTEVGFFEIYKDQPMFETLKKYLNSKGFYFYRFTSRNQYFGDAVFLNKNLLKINSNSLITLLNDRMYKFLDEIKKIWAFVKKLIKYSMRV